MYVGRYAIITFVERMFEFGVVLFLSEGENFGFLLFPYLVHWHCGSSFFILGVFLLNE